MNKKLLAAISAMVLVILVCALIFRYEQLENTDGLQRYVDRWTGVEWVKVITPGSTSRIPAKYYNFPMYDDAASLKVLKDLTRIKNINDTLMTIWYVLVFASAASALYNLINIRKPYKNSKGEI